MMMFRVPTLAFNFERMADEVVFSWPILMGADSKKFQSTPSSSKLKNNYEKVDGGLEKAINQKKVTKNHKAFFSMTMFFVVQYICHHPIDRV